jgi:hypothetical protein
MSDDPKENLKQPAINSEDPANPDVPEAAHSGSVGDGVLFTKTLQALHDRVTTLSPEKEKKRDAWDRAGLIASWTAALIIPVVLGIGGYFLNLALKNRESQTKMVELAIDLLKVDPKPNDEDKALRNWAMDVIDRYSEVKMPQKVRNALESAPLDVAFGPPEGRATTPATRELNRLKNRAALPSQRDIDPEITLEKMLAPGDDRDRFDPSRAATVRGFVVRVLGGGKVSANPDSNDPTFRDTHFELALAKNAHENQRLIAFVTPRLRQLMRQKGHDWSTQALRDPQTGIVGKKVEITGWLLFDFLHANSAENTNPGGRQNWRATCWEIHPVTEIKTLD